MAHDNGNGSNTALGFTIGLVAGAVLGVGLALLLAPKEGEALRRELGERVKKLKDDAMDTYRQAADVAAEWAEEGADVAERVRTAANDGLREVRRHAAGVPGSGGAGAEGTAENG